MRLKCELAGIFAAAAMASTPIPRFNVPLPRRCCLWPSDSVVAPDDADECHFLRTGFLLGLFRSEALDPTEKDDDGVDVDGTALPFRLRFRVFALLVA